MIRNASFFAFLAAALFAIGGSSLAGSSIPTTDPYLWLENVTSPRAMSWVRAQNARSLRVLQTDPHYPHFYADALAVAQAKDRIPAPDFVGGRIFNFWQDREHIRGLWRSTTLAHYANPHPAWTTALDLDALARRESANWVWEGADCLWPAEQRCLLALSDGGEDAVTEREFDLRTKAFVGAGFVLPRGKQTATWADGGMLLVAREWEPGDLTASGYPFIVKQLRRGAPLAHAVEIFRGTKTDIEVRPAVLDDVQGDHVALIERARTFFTSEWYLLTSHGVERLGLPLKSTIDAVIAGRMLVTLAEPWSVNGHTFTAGSLVALDLRATYANPTRLQPFTVYAPGPRDALDTVATTAHRVLLSTLHNVRGQAYAYAPVPGDRWTAHRLALPDNSALRIAAVDAHGETAFLNVTGFLTPTTLWQTDLATQQLAIAKALPAKFDASKDIVEQREATSKDGTAIPYFIVRPKALKRDGANPTILYAYGGFAISETPNYSPAIGKLWLEHGGIFVVANIRGGGEFGPAWHEAGLQTKRQRIYDDFVAVARDLIARRITNAAHLGIQGGSNGGLLMGVEFTQHPELWRAVDIGVPLLDMLRYEQIAAGASWVGEYGSVAVPAQRAFLASISPYNNIKPGQKYPEPFIWTTTKDDRVGPQHARKFAARLAQYHIPYLFYEVTEGGHGAGANLKERAHTTALEMTYFTQKLMSDEVTR